MTIHTDTDTDSEAVPVRRISHDEGYWALAALDPDVEALFAEVEAIVSAVRTGGCPPFPPATGGALTGTPAVRRVVPGGYRPAPGVHRCAPCAPCRAALRVRGTGSTTVHDT